MKITSKFVTNNTRKFDWIDCRDRISSESSNWPEVGVEIEFWSRTFEQGGIKVQMSNTEAEALVLAVLAQANRNRRDREEYERKQVKK